MSKAPEMPAKGGSYVRQEDGTLKRQDRSAAEPKQAKPTTKKNGAK